MEQIQERKRELENEIHRVEEKYSSKASSIEKTVQSTLRPVKKIRDKPFVAVGLSAALGFLIGVSGRKKRSRKKDRDLPEAPAVYSGKQDSGFTSLVAGELKRLAARKAIAYFSEWVDHSLMPELTSRLKNKEKRDQTASEDSAD